MHHLIPIELDLPIFEAITIANPNHTYQNYPQSISSKQSN